MSPEKQRIAIAEACGWKTFHINGTVNFGMCEPNAKWIDDDSRYIMGKPSPDAGLSSMFAPPDYLSDLNAMHEAEKELESLAVYLLVLRQMIGATDSTDPVLHGGEAAACVHATAKQRAEAFLRTLGKWEE